MYADKYKWVSGKRKKKLQRKALLEAYLFVCKTQLMFQYCLAICQNLHLIRKRVESVRYGLSEMKVCHSGWPKFSKTWPQEGEEKAEVGKTERREKKRSCGDQVSFNC
jgi:hypothetical protein